MLRSPGPSFSAPPERVPASEEVLRAREEARRAKEAAEANFDCDMSCYEDFDDIEEQSEAPNDVKPSFGKLPTSFPIFAIPQVKMEHPAATEKQEATKALKGSLLVVTPAKTTRKEREALGSERKLAAVRRSSRLLPSAAEEQHPELVDVKEAEDFKNLLSDFGYFYAPNPKLPTKKRPTQFLNDQMQALSLNEKQVTKKPIVEKDNVEECEDEDSLDDLDPMMREEEMVEEPSTAMKEEEMEEPVPTAPAPILVEDAGGRFQEVIPVTRKQSKKTCLTPVVRSTRLAQKRLQNKK